MKNSELLFNEYQNIKKQFRSTKLLGLKQTKLNETVLMYTINTSTKNHFTKTISALTRIDNHFVSHSAYVNKKYDYDVVDNERETLYILDIKILGNENINKGYGTLLMDEIIKMGKKESCSSVTGNARASDSYNKIRQNNFYKKYGFEFHERRFIRLPLNY